MHVRRSMDFVVRQKLSQRYCKSQTSSNLVKSLCRKPRPYLGMLTSCWSSFVLQMCAQGSSRRLQTRTRTGASMRLTWLLTRTPRLSACAPLYALASLLSQSVSCLLLVPPSLHGGRNAMLWTGLPYSIILLISCEILYLQHVHV